MGEKQESILAEAANAEGGTKEEKGKVEEEGDAEGVSSSSSGTLSLIKILQTSDIPTSWGKVESAMWTSFVSMLEVGRDAWTDKGQTCRSEVWMDGRSRMADLLSERQNVRELTNSLLSSS